MIVNKILKINNGSAPYTYTVLPSNCISVSSLTGVLNENEAKLLTFNIDEGCSPTITISVVDSNGCPNTLQYSFTNVCSNLALTLSQSNYTFIATASGGSGVYTYQWIYDTAKFTANNDTNSSIVLTPIGTQVTNTVTCIVTDSNECTKLSQITFQPCKGTLVGALSETYCTTDAYVSEVIELKYIGCDYPNWDKLVFVGIDGLSGVNWTYNVVNSTSTSIFVRFTFPKKEITTVPNVVKIIGTVTNSYNIISNSAEIKINISECAAFQGVVTGIGTVQKIGQGTQVGQRFLKPLADYITSTYPLDWDSFTFIASTGQTFNNKIDMTVQAGNLYLTTNHEILFEIFNTPTRDVEIVKWTIEDIYGTISNTVQEIYILKALDAPTVANDSLCGITNQLFSINGIFTNDTGYVVDSFLVTQQPLHGNIVIDGTNIYFSPAIDFKGTDTFKYKVANADGLYSAEATVTITIISSGISINTNNIIC